MHWPNDRIGGIGNKCLALDCALASFVAAWQGALIRLRDDATVMRGEERRRPMQKRNIAPGGSLWGTHKRHGRHSHRIRLGHASPSGHNGTGGYRRRQAPWV